MHMQCYLYPSEVLVSMPLLLDYQPRAQICLSAGSLTSKLCGDVVAVLQAHPPSVTDTFAFRDERVNRAFCCQLIDDAARCIGLSATMNTPTGHLLSSPKVHSSVSDLAVSHVKLLSRAVCFICAGRVSPYARLNSSCTASTTTTACNNTALW